MKTAFLVICGLLANSLYGQIKLEPYRLGITVKNAEQAAQWYQQNLGFKVYKQMSFPEYDSLKIYFLKWETFEIELVEKKTSFSIKDVRPGYNINKEPLEGFSKIAFRTDSLRQTYEKLKKNGVKEIMGLTHDEGFNVDFFIIEDPDGNMLQFIGQNKK